MGDAGQIRLGRSDLMISRIGYGSAAVAGLWGPQDEQEVALALREAVDAGINWVDCQEGPPEEVMGRSIQQLPEDVRPLVFIKCLRRTDVGPRGTVDLSPESIRIQVDGSLQRLGMDAVDLLFFHWPDPGVPIEESWGAVHELIGEGKIRAGGLSNFSVDLLERAEAVGHVDAVQQPLSLLDRGMNGAWGDSGGLDVLRWARSHDVGVTIYGPLQHGLITGSFTYERATVDIVEAGEVLRPMTFWFREPELPRALELVEGLKPIAARHDTTLAALAVAWVLAWDGVTSAICGARRPGQVAGFADALTMELTSEDLDEIADLIERTAVGIGTSGDGPARPE